MKAKIVSFSRTFARETSANEAIIMKFLAYKTRRSTNLRDELMWYYASTKELASKFPFISASAIDANIRKLHESGKLMVANHNKWTRDRTRWFSVTAPTIDDVERDLIKFDEAVAVKHGVTAAVLMFNLEHWIKRKLKKSTGTDVSHMMSPTALGDLLPFSASTIKSSLDYLVTKGMIIKTSTTKPEYTLPPDRILALRREAMLRK